jgi:hypothetical protein
VAGGRKAIGETVEMGNLSSTKMDKPWKILIDIKKNIMESERIEGPEGAN